MSWYKRSQDDYHGYHRPSLRGDGAPLYDLTAIWPDDIYSVNGARYYGHIGHGDPMDESAIAVIRAYRGRPNATLMVYRAIPDLEHDLKSQIKDRTHLVSYFNKFGFFPINNQIVNKISSRYPLDDYEYDERQQLIFNDLLSSIEELEGKLGERVVINPGDWVTINREYAKLHGEGLNGKYKIISKRVKASDIFTEGNSILEWGYDP